MIVTLLIAASLSLTSPDDYYFVDVTNAPFAVTNIVGRGIGSNPSKTQIQPLRYEDVFFAREAFYERAYFGITNYYRHFAIGNPYTAHAGLFIRSNLDACFSSVDDAMWDFYGITLISNECEPNFNIGDLVEIEDEFNPLDSLIGYESYGHWKYKPGEFPFWLDFSHDYTLYVTNISRFIYGNLADLGIVSMYGDVGRATMNSTTSRDYLTDCWGWNSFSEEWVENKSESSTNYTEKVEDNSFFGNDIFTRSINVHKGLVTERVYSHETGESHLESKQNTAHEDTYVGNQGVIYRKIDLLSGQSINQNGGYPIAMVCVDIDQTISKYVENDGWTHEKIADGYYLVKAECFIEDGGRSLLVAIHAGNIESLLESEGVIQPLRRSDMYSMIDYPQQDERAGLRENHVYMNLSVKCDDIIYLIRPTWRAKELQ